MNCKIKDALSHMNYIYNDNDMSSFWNLDSLVNLISDSKEFGLSWGDIDRWWIVFLTLLRWEWMWEIDVTTLFLMLVSETIMTDLGSNDVFEKILSRLWR